MTVANNIKDYRISKNMSQSQLAKKMNKSQQTISALENGTASPTIRALYSLAEVLDVTLIDLCIENDFESKDEYTELEIKHFLQSELIEQFNQLNKSGMLAAIEQVKILTLNEDYNDNLERKPIRLKDIISDQLD